MADIASLIIRVTTAGVDRATSDIGSLGRAATSAIGAIGGLAAATKVFNSLVASQRNFDKLNSGLITMTGSAENAAKAFQVLQQFAKDTPYGLNQAVEGFTKLVALGLDPSKEALISYGNTAAAMGKDLNQMIEAVADAATGEFERLKEFGIKASQQGDKVSFTFRGVTTTVKKNSEEIQKYLLNIGNTDFAGAMETRAQTLDGALSSLADTFDGVTLSIAQSGFGDALADQVRTLEVIVQQAGDTIASGQFTARLQDWATVATESFQFVGDAFADLGDGLTEKSDETADNLGGIPEAIRYWLPELQRVAKDMYAEFQTMALRANNLAAAIQAAFTPGESAKGVYEAGERAITLLEDLEKSKNQAQADGIRERSAAREKEYNEERKQYEERRKQEIDLRSLVSKPPGSSSSSSGSASGTDKAAKASAKLAEQQRAQAEAFIDTVKRQNQDELAAIDEQERQKLAKLDEFQKEGALKAGEYESTKTQILKDAEAQRNDILLKQTEKRMQEQQSAEEYLEQLRAQNGGELDEIDRQYTEKLRKLEEFNEKVKYSEEELAQARKDIQESADQARLESQLQIGEQIAGNIASAADEGTAVYKAASITQAIISTYLAATKALAEGGPILGPILAASSVALGLANVAKIRSAREQGGSLAVGQVSTIAERGKAEVIMPASASRVRTAAQMRQIMGESNKSQGNSSVVIVNQTSGRIDSVQQEQDDEGRLRLIIREEMVNQTTDSNSQFSQARKATRGQPGY